MNFHSLAPKRYKRALVSGFVHRIYRACSSWHHFHESIEKAKTTLENNQYPPSFYNKIINDTLTKIVEKPKQRPPEIEEDPHLLFLQYRGKNTESFARDLHKTKVPCRIVFTLKKLKTVMPSLKEPIDKQLKSGVVYKISCPRCNACYVGQTGRHLQVRFREHINRKGPVKEHFQNCDVTYSENEKDLPISCSAALTLFLFLVR